MKIKLYGGNIPMQTNSSKFSICFFIILSICVLNSCSFFQNSENEEIQQLKDQVNLLATQNAQLMNQDSSSNSEELEAPSPPGEDTEAQITLSTPTSESLPVNPVPAGVPIIYDGWSLLVSKNLEIEPSGLFGDGPIFINFTISLKNLSMDNRIFRFTNAALTIKDDLGNNYPYFPGWEGNHYNCEQEYYTLKNLTIEGEDSIQLEGSPKNCDSQYFFTVFEGPVPLEANQLILMLDDFGPFTGVEVIIDL